MINVMNELELKTILQEVDTAENRLRRAKAFKELDVYSGNQDKYIMGRISTLYGKDACDHIQPITAINLARRIATAEASIYRDAPKRTFNLVSDKEQEQLDAHYGSLEINQAMYLANSLYRLGNQCQVQVIPKSGELMARVLYQHQYDVVPYFDDPARAEMYIIHLQASKSDRANFFNVSDNVNQKIADKNDSDLSRMKYIIWTDKYNFKCNGLGQILDPLTDEPHYNYLEEEILNPIGQLPFIDIASQKTLGFYPGGGSELSDFSIAFGVILTDLGEIVKLQGYSQGVISSLEEPRSLSIGPHRALWLKKDKNEPGDKDPSFQFVSPSPDLQGSMNYAENVLRMFLTSRGTDSKLVSSIGAKDFASGFERLLAMVDRAEATKSDKELFRNVEHEIFELVVKWNNYLISTTDGMLEENKITSIRDADQEKLSVAVKFYEPSQILTQDDKEKSIQNRLELGLMTKQMAVMELYELDEVGADKLLLEISAEIELPVAGLVI